MERKDLYYWKICAIQVTIRKPIVKSCGTLISQVRNIHAAFCAHLKGQSVEIRVETKSLNPFS
jgi:hypothetical protein